MKKIIIFVVSTIALALIAGVGYFFLFQESDYGEVRPPKDLTGVVVPPVEYPLNGKKFMIPTTGTSTAVSIVLDLISPTATRDYPMARFTDADGVTAGSLVALDDFQTSFESNKRAVPIMIAYGETEQNYYLAVLAGEEVNHVSSLLIGEFIKIKSISRAGDLVTVNYFVHDRGQLFTDEPRVETSAIFNIESNTTVQAGRSPSTEVFVETKSFVGEYLWSKTVAKNGTTVTPSKPNTFTLLFDANRISLGTDCNSGSANFVAESGSSTKFTIDNIAQTKMFCESAQEGEYFAMMSKITNYSEAKDGTITFTLSDDREMQFEPKAKKLEFAATSTES